uniref:RES domain-containing protein n=1 Tax=Globodera pallida TaxID=36090 RepID=A0A183CCG4_GLOPA
MSLIKKIDKDSVEGLEGSLSLFSLPPTNVAINKTNVRELLPLSALNQTGPYLFRLFSDSQYCDLSKTYLYLLSSIERKNTAGEWVPISDTEPTDKHVGVIQNFGSSFIRSLKVNISGIEVFDSSIYYHYRDYIMQELGYSHEIRKALHEAGCYYVDDNDQNLYTNKGFTARASRFAGGQQCETMVKLNFDLARQNALMLNNQDVIFTIHRNNDAFLLLTPPWKTAGAGGVDVWHENAIVKICGKTR